MDADFVDWLNLLREEANFPFVITSGYRCPEHPIEKRKSKPGAHSTGRAVDIAVSGAQSIIVMKLALNAGCERIGVNQKGGSRFIHLDLADKPSASWSY